MKKYIKPAIEEVNLGVYTPIAQSPSYREIHIDSGLTVIDPAGGEDDGGDGGYGQWAPGKKGSNDEDFGW